MLENVRGLLIAISVTCWILAAIVVVIMLRIRVPPEIRAQFRTAARWYTAGVVAAMASMILHAMWTHVVLPGWFYGCIWIGILIPWQIALHVAGTDMEAYRQTGQ
jgi:hypothetical protein